MPGEGVGVDLVHDREIAHVEKEHRGLGHIGQRGTAVAEHGDHVGQHLAGLGRRRRRRPASRWPDRSPPGRPAPASRRPGRPVSKGRPKRGRSGSARSRRASATSSSSTMRSRPETTEPDLAAANESPTEGFTPLTVEEAQAVMTDLTGVDRSALLAERAEAEAQLRAAEATLGVPPPATNGQARAQEQEPDEPAQNTPIVNSGGNPTTTEDTDRGHRRAVARRRRAPPGRRRRPGRPTTSWRWPPRRPRTSSARPSRPSPGPSRSARTCPPPGGDWSGR